MGEVNRSWRCPDPIVGGLTGPGGVQTPLWGGFTGPGGSRAWPDPQGVTNPQGFGALGVSRLPVLIAREGSGLVPRSVPRPLLSALPHGGVPRRTSTHGHPLSPGLSEILTWCLALPLGLWEPSGDSGAPSPRKKAVTGLRSARQCWQRSRPRLTQQFFLTPRCRPRFRVFPWARGGFEQLYLTPHLCQPRKMGRGLCLLAAG